MRVCINFMYCDFFNRQKPVSDTVGATTSEEVSADVTLMSLVQQFSFLMSME